MSVVLFCALSYNRDLQGKRCGYDCTAVSTAMSKVVNLPEIEVAYLPVSGSDSAMQFNGQLRVEISYGVARVSRSIVNAVPNFEVCYTYTGLPVVQCIGISAEVAFPRYLHPAVSQVKTSRAEFCFSDGTKVNSGISTDVPSAVNADSVKAEYSCVPLHQSGNAVVISPSIEVAYTSDQAVTVGQNIPVSDISAQLATKIRAESTWSAAHFPGCISNKPDVEIAYLQGTSHDNDFNLVSDIGVEASYTCTPASVNAGLDHVGIELAFSSKEDSDNLYLVFSSVAAEVTFSTWSGNTSPAVQPWQVVVGNDPESPLPTDDMVYIPCLASDSLVMVSTDSGAINGMLYFPSAVSCLRKNELLSVVNSGLRIVDLSWTNPDHYYVVRPGITSAVAAGDLTVFTCIDGTAVILDNNNNLTEVNIPIQVICSAYDTVNKTYCFGCQDGTLYFLTSSFNIRDKVSLKGPIVQIQRSQYGTIPCFVVTSQGSRSISIYNSGDAGLLSSTAFAGTLRSGLYNIPSLSLYSTISESADIYHARSDLIWFPNQLSIKGQPWCLTGKGSRVYYTDSEHMTAGWI